MYQGLGQVTASLRETEFEITEPYQPAYESPVIGGYPAPDFSVEVWDWATLPWWVWLLLAYAVYEVMKKR